MEILHIEAPAFEAMLRRLDYAEAAMAEVCRRSDSKKLGEWWDSQEVCLRLNITKRTLQSYRDKGLLPFGRIEDKKTLYKKEDVEKLMQESHHPKKRSHE